MNYSLSFTAGALLTEESRLVAPLFLEFEDLKLIRKSAIETRLLSARTESAGKRVLSEIISRLTLLPTRGLELVSHGRLEEARQALWLACCLRYPIVADFAEGPLAESSRLPGGSISTQDLESFFLSQQALHPELSAASEGTKAKLRQVLRLMLVQAGLLSDSGRVGRGLLAPGITELIHEIPRSKLWVGGMFLP